MEFRDMSEQSVEQMYAFNQRSLPTSTPEQLHSGSLRALHPGNVSGQLQRGRHCLSP